MTLGRDTVGFACLSVRSAQKRDAIGENVLVAVIGQSQVRRRNLYSRRSMPFIPDMP